MRKTPAVLGLILVFLLPARAAADAESTYKEQCAKCHRANGEGAGRTRMKIKPADLRSPEVQKKTDKELYKCIGYDVGHKEYAHAFAERGLSAKQIADLVTSVRKFAETSKRNK